MIGRPKAVVVTVLFGTVLIVGGLTVALVRPHSGARADGAAAASTTSSTSTTTTAPDVTWRAVPPATTVPQATPTQQQYDEGLAVGLSSPANRVVMARADAVRLPSPAIGDGWPHLRPDATPEGWAAEFVGALLDVDFAHETRAGLAAWLVAEEALDLMPGVRPDFTERSLVTSLLYPAISGQATPVPSAAGWARDARAGVRWETSGMLVQLDPRWQAMIDAGWQPRDLRAAVEDISGLLTVTEGRRSRRERFSLVLQVGSAHWRDGYGAVLVADWKEA